MVDARWLAASIPTPSEPVFNINRLRYQSKHDGTLYVGKNGILHCTQCGALVINGSTNWTLHQMDQVNKIDSLPRGPKVIFTTTSDCLPIHLTGEVISGWDSGPSGHH